MKKLLTLIALGCTCVAFQAQAADKAPTAQQGKMTTCSKEADGKKGDERKAFMKSCLSSTTAAAPATQQDKMKTCNADTKAKTLKGDDRKAFMKQCLSGKAA